MFPFTEDTHYDTGCERRTELRGPLNCRDSQTMYKDYELLNNEGIYHTYYGREAESICETRGETECE